MLKIKALIANFSLLTTLSILSISCWNNKKETIIAKDKFKKINIINDKKEIKKYTIILDNKEMIFDSKEEIVFYLLNQIKINRFLGKYEYKDYDGRININPEKFNYFDVSKLKNAYKDIYGNYTDDKESVIRSYLPEFAIVKRYYDHTDKPFINSKDAIDSILANCTNNLVDNWFYKFKYNNNGETKWKYYNPYNKNDIEQLMIDINDGKILYNGETQKKQCLILENNGEKRIFVLKTNTANLYENLFKKIMQIFVQEATKEKYYKISLKLERMDKYNHYRDFGEGNFENISSIDGEESWQYDANNRTIFKYVDKTWIKNYFENFEVFKDNSISKTFVKNNFNTHYVKKITTYDNEDYQKELEKYKKSSNPRKRPPKETITKVHYDHFANLKGKFLDFKTLTLSAKNFKKDSEYVTVLSYDKYTYNNFGLKITIDFDKSNFNHKLKNLLNEKFAKDTNYLINFHSLIEKALNELLLNEKNIMQNWENIKKDLILVEMLWDIFLKWLNKIIDKNNDIYNNYFSLKFDDYFESYYKNTKNNDWVRQTLEFNWLNIFNIIDFQKSDLLPQTITYYKNKPIFYNDTNNNFINISNKEIINNDLLSLINLNKNDKNLWNNSNKTQNLIKSHNSFAKNSKIIIDDDYLEDVLYIDEDKLEKFFNFIKYNKSDDNNIHYILNNSYILERTFESEGKIQDYLNMMRVSGILPESRYIIVGLESTLKAHGIKMLTEELGFNSPDIILNNPEAILQKLILPSTKKVFYEHKGEKYLLDIKYFNLWNIKINNKTYFFW